MSGLAGLISGTDREETVQTKTETANESEEH